MDFVVFATLLLTLGNELHMSIVWTGYVTIADMCSSCIVAGCVVAPVRPTGSFPK